MAAGNGNGELTREILRAEMNAALAWHRDQMKDYISDELEPLRSHLARIDRGEFNEAQKAAIERAVDDSAAAGWSRLGVKAGLAYFLIAMAGLGTSIVALVTR